jgi:hypothetical protein
MSLSLIELNFGNLILQAELFETPVAAKFSRNLPCEISLVQWGNELYGPIGHDLGVHAPVPEIPPGGIAYTGQGGYLCIFFGQQPAWPVEYIGKISGDDWKKLLHEQSLGRVTVRLKEE